MMGQALFSDFLSMIDIKPFNVGTNGSEFWATRNQNTTSSWSNKETNCSNSKTEVLCSNLFDVDLLYTKLAFEISCSDFVSNISSPYPVNLFSHNTFLQQHLLASIQPNNWIQSACAAGSHQQKPLPLERLDHTGSSVSLKSTYTHLVTEKGTLFEADHWRRIIRPTMMRHKHVYRARKDPGSHIHSIQTRQAHNEMRKELKLGWSPAHQGSLNRKWIQRWVKQRRGYLERRWEQKTLICHIRNEFLLLCPAIKFALVC